MIEKSLGTHQTSFPKKVDRFVLVALAMSLALNVYFGVKALPQRRVVPSSLQVGSVVPELHLLQSDGASRTVRFVGATKPTVLYLFTARCSWCIKNAPYVDALAAATRTAGRYDFLPVCLDCGSSNKAAVGGYMALRLGSQTSTLGEYRLPAVPSTLFVSADGKIEQLWAGAYFGKTRDLIEQYFSLDLDQVEAGKDVAKNVTP